ncbi:hypothetical protein LBYZC6_17840 [Lacrimispora brassicae]
MVTDLVELIGLLRTIFFIKHIKTVDYRNKVKDKNSLEENSKKDLNIIKFK